MTSSKHTSAEQILKELPPAPKDIRQFVLSHASAYMIINKNAGVGICTHCETELELYTQPQYTEPAEEAYSDYFKYKHNAEGYCPNCGRIVTVKSSGKGRKKLTERHRVLIPIMKEKTLYMSLTEVIIDFTGWGAELYEWFSAVYKVNEEELTYCKHHLVGWYREEYWELNKNFRLPGPPAQNWKDYMYHNADISGCCEQLKYLDIPAIAKEYNWNPELFVGFIREAYKYPAIEMLYKSGFKSLVRQRAREWTTKCMNIRAKSLPKIFRSNMETVRDLSEMDAEIRQVEEYKNILEKYGLRYKEYAELNLATGIDEGATSAKLKKLKLNKSIMKRAVEYAANNGIWYHNWIDYIEQLEILDIEMNSKTMFPKDFRAEHEKLSKRIKIKKDEVLRRKMAQTIAKNKATTVKVDGLLFIPAATPEELETEGQQQHHCVAMYAERVARGQCLIYMVRKESEPDKSYMTMELSPDGEIRQLRGFANRSPEEDVRVTAEKFTEMFKKNIKKEKKTA